MQKLKLNILPKDKFVSNYIVPLYKTLLIDELNNNHSEKALNYLNKYYKISKKDIITEIKRNMVTHKVNENYYIFIPDYIEINHIPVSQIISFVNDGNYHIKGSLRLNKIINYIESNISYFYKMYVLKGGY